MYESTVFLWAAFVTKMMRTDSFEVTINSQDKVSSGRTSPRVPSAMIAMQGWSIGPIERPTLSPDSSIPEAQAIVKINLERS